MSLDAMVELLQGYCFAPGDHERQRAAAGALISAGVDPDKAGRLFEITEASAAPDADVARLVAALVMKPDKLKRALADMEKAEAAKAARAAKRKKPYPGASDFKEPEPVDPETRERPTLPDWASQQSHDAAAGIKVVEAGDTAEFHRERLERFRRDMAERQGAAR